MTRAPGTRLWSLAIAMVLSVGWLLARPVAAKGAAPTPVGNRPGRALSADTGALPDSVLASVGTGRVISVSAFRDAWSRAESTAPLDSITPEEARRFLGLLIDRELLAERAARETWTWTAAESAGYRTLRDRLMVRAALDSALGEARRAWGGEAESDPERIGIMLRDSTVARMEARFDDALLERLARAWSRIPAAKAGSAVAEQLAALAALPEIDPADSGRVLARSTAGSYRVGVLLDSWRRLSIAYRPRIENASQLRDLVENGLFERALRHAAESRHLELSPAPAAVLKAAREDIAVAHLAEREIYRDIPRDSVTLLRCYQREREQWVLPLRVRVVRLVLGDRTAAEADSLEARARRQGLDYAAEWSLTTDSSSFTAAMRAGVGAVLGPRPEGDDWLVARVTAILPGRPLRFDEVRDRIEKRWIELEAERRTRALCDRLLERNTVLVNERALTRMILDPALVTGGREP